ncbi:winged helix-turn-helix domain-containing protein [Trichothermofontia sp.]
MTVPDYQSLMLPLLRYAGTCNRELTTNEAIEVLAQELNLTEEDLREMLPSDTQSTFGNRVGWAATCLKKAGLLESIRRCYYQITATGRELLNKQPQVINVKLLEQYPEFLEFKKLKGIRSRNGERCIDPKLAPDTSAATPSEALEAAYENLRDELANELLAKLKKISPALFERGVVELLVKMGYGGSRSDAGRAIGESSDGGIDSIIKEDKLAFPDLG